MSQRSDGRPVKYIFVTGGVVSSLGKGLAAASIGRLLEDHGYTVALQKFDPYINVDPGHDEPVPARRGLRHRRRRRDRSRSRSLRALHQHGGLAEQQLDDRQDLSVGDPEGAPRRLSRTNRAGHSAHHQRDQGCDPHGRPGRRRRPRRNRRHRRRHREHAVPRSDPPVPPRRRPREHALHSPDAGAVHRHGRRAEDQADAAQRPRPALDRHPARHPALPHRPLPRHRPQAEDRALLRRHRRRGHHREGRRDDLRSAAGAEGGGARSDRPAHAGAAADRSAHRSVGRADRSHQESEGRNGHSRRRQVHRLRGLVQEPQRGGRITAASSTGSR